MHSSKLFKKVPVDIQNSSGFDCSFEHAFTAKVGTLVPCLSRTLCPGDKVHLSLPSVEIQLPPMATSFYGKVVGKFEAFFVPHRIIDAGWKDLVEKTTVGVVPRSWRLKFTTESTLTAALVAQYKSVLGRGSLADYLGLKASWDTTTSAGRSLMLNNLHPFLAYHKIWDDWYRNPFIQQQLFDPRTGLNFQGTLYSPWTKSLNDSYLNVTDVSGLTGLHFCKDSSSTQLGSTLFSLHQRNYPKGYFTSATPNPQYGNESSVNVISSVSGESAEGSFSIATLRAANSLQKFVERNNIGGGRYADLILGQYGVLPSDSLVNRAIYIGSHTVPVYSRSVFDTVATGENDRNPFIGSVGASGGASSGYSKNGFLGSFKATEHGTLMVLFSLVPRAIYSTGLSRELRYSTYADYPNPLLAGIGNQEIRSSELGSNLQYWQDNYDLSFGYTDRYAEAKYVEDQVSGLFADGESLDAFVQKRSFTFASLGSSFISIPVNALDDVCAVASDVSNYGCQVDANIGFKKVSVLPEYSVPTLGDEKNTHSIMVDKGGRQL